MKGRISFIFFTVLVFFIVLLPIIIVLIKLSDIINWVSTRSFFGGNVLILTALIPLVSVVLLCLGLGIITRREERRDLAARERMKQEHPPGRFGENELRDITVLIEALNGSLERIKRGSDELRSLSETITRIHR
jgi:hypothetical protein